MKKRSKWLLLGIVFIILSVFFLIAKYSYPSYCSSLTWEQCGKSYMCKEEMLYSGSGGGSTGGPVPDLMRYLSCIPKYLPS